MMTGIKQGVASLRAGGDRLEILVEDDGQSVENRVALFANMFSSLNRRCI